MSSPGFVLPPGAKLVTPGDDQEGVKLPPGAKLVGAAAPASPPKPPPSFYNDTSLGRGLKAFGLASGGTENAADLIQGPKFAIQHPITAGQTVWNAAAQSQQDLIDRAYREQHSPGVMNKVAGFVHGAESAVPFLGTALAHAGDLFSQGKVAEGVGSTLGTAAPMLTASPEVAGTVSQAMGKIGDVAGALKPPPGLIQRGVRASMGLGETPMVKTAKAALEKNAFEAGQVASANAQAAADHAVKVAKVEGLNEAGQAAVAKRAQLHQQTLDDSAALAQGVQQKALAVRAQGKAMYDEVSQAVAQKLGPDAGVAAPDVAALVKHAEDNILAGSRPEAIKQFRMMLEEAKQTGGPNAAVLDQTAQGLGYKSAADAIQRLGPEQFQRYLPSDLQGVEAVPANIPFKDLGGYVTELGDLMYNRGVPNDVFAAMRYVRDGMQGMRQQMATQAGVGDKLVAANQFWRNYENIYNNTRGVSVAARGLGPEGIGSPIAKIVRAVDPPTIRQIVTGNASQRLIKTLGAEDPALGKLAQQIADNHAQAKDLPARYKLKETPEAPEPKPLPEQPNLAQTVEDARLKRLDEQIRTLRSTKAFAYEVPLAIVGLFRHGLGGLVAGEFATRQALAKLFEQPATVRWLTSTTPRELEILNQLDPHQKVPLQQAITQKMVEQKLAPTPAMKSFLLPAQVAAITAASQAGQPRDYPTPQSVMLGMKSGDLTPDEGARMLQRLRRSASAGPTRRLPQPETPPAPPGP